MPYPSLEQYNEALQSPQLYLQDAELKRGVVRKSGLGLPLALCGGFALTYTIEAGGRKHALRCFHKESRELERRYLAIAQRLKGLASSYFLPFEFNPQGIRVQGQLYPTVKMAWASGRTLAEFLESEHRNAPALKRLRQALSELASYLEAHDLAHGDIQPENVMVSADGGTVQLIDYDGLYVGALAGSQATELGQINFQHPHRTAQNFNAQLDRFSFLALDVALQALIASPALWTMSRSEPSAVVFRRNDFLDPGSSAVFQEAVRVPGIKAHVENLARVAAGAFSAIPKLSEFLQGLGISAQQVVIRSRPGTMAYQSAYPVCNAADFTQVMGLVGSRVELVGRIQSVRNAFTKRGTPYIFVNFADWRGSGVKLNIWSEGLDAIRPQLVDSSWVGRWLSVTGLVDQPYRKPSYTHLSITITAKGQLQTLTEQDALYRLGAGGQAAAAVVSRNADILQGMGGRQPRRRSTATPVAPSPPRSSNQQILTQMQRPSASTPPAGASRSTHTTPTHQAPASNTGCFPLVVIIGAGLLLLRLLG